MLLELENIIIVERTIRKRKVPNVNVFKGLHDTWYMYTM